MWVWTKQAHMGSKLIALCIGFHHFFLFLVHLVLDFDTYTNSSALLFYSFEVAFILSMSLSQKTTYFMVVSMWCLPTIWMWLFKLQPSAIILFDDSHMQGINKEVFPRVRVNSNSLKLLFFPIAKMVGVLSIMVGLTNVSKGLVK